jgi:hypothetical protein
MKKFPLLTLSAFFLASIVTTSCSDSDDPIPELTAPAGKIVAIIAGTSFEADGAAQIFNDEIMLGGNSGTQSISVIVTKAAVVGTYEVKGAAVGVTTPDAEVNYTPDGSTLYSSASATDGEIVGTVVITGIDETNKTISGLFNSRVVLDGVSKDVVSGSFNKIPYTTEAPSTLSAKVDGDDFAATVVVAQRAQGSIVVNGQTLNGSQILMLTFNDDITVGPHSIGQLNGGDIYTTYFVSLNPFVSTEGTLTITKHDVALKRVEGTFSFDALPPLGEGDGHTITQGAFAVTYN